MRALDFGFRNRWKGFGKDLPLGSSVSNTPAAEVRRRRTNRTNVALPNKSVVAGTGATTWEKAWLAEVKLGSSQKPIPLIA